ncbi:helix-turn-helix transcriptional regulator [Actinomyces slackii]|nr:metalloregulator ArsR/SmtB family transcription factor [Actinomyces slackii]
MTLSPPTELETDSAEASEDRFATLATTARALGDPVRLAVFTCIASASTEICVCDIINSCGRSQATISYHLKKLREAGLVVPRREGTWIWYRLNEPVFKQFRDAVASLTSRSATTTQDPTCCTS